MNGMGDAYRFTGAFFASWGIDTLSDVGAGVIGETRSLGEQARQCESRDGCSEESLMLVPMYVHFAGGSPQRGLTRRLRRGWWGCRPRGEKSFLSKRKKGPKKARGTATPEAARPAARRGLRSAGALRAVLDLGSLRSPAGKKASIAHFDGGARNVARNGVG